MRKIVFLLIFFVFSCSDSEQHDEMVSASKSTIAMSKSFGGSMEENINGVVNTSDGGMIIIGSTNSNDGDILKDNDKIDIWLLRIDKNGDKVWSKTIGGSQNDYGSSIIATKDGNYIIAGYSASSDGDIPGNVGLHDFFIAKINDSGDIIWNKNYGFTGHDHAHKIIQTRDGGYFVVGFAEYSGIEGSGGNENNGEGHEIGHRNVLHGSGEYLGIKIDENGNFKWFRYFGGTQNDRINDVVEANDGGLVMVGYSESSNFDITDNKGSYDFWVVKINENGSLHWKHSYGGSAIDQAYGITKTDNNSYLVVGRTNSVDMDVSKSLGNFDAWVIHIDDHGHLIWNKSFGGTEFDTATTIKKLSNGNFGIVGNTRSILDGKVNRGQNDFWICEIDNKANSSMFWQTTVGGSNIDLATDFYQNEEKDFIVIGESQSNDFDTQQNKGGSDLWVVQLK